MKILKYIAIFVIFAASVCSSFAVTIRVPSEQATIQTAINSASNLDTVLVAPGTYKVNLNFKGKSIVLTSEAGPLLTILKPYSSSLPIVVFENSESPLAVLERFTFSGRYNKPAVQIYSSSPIVQDNIFTNNDAYYGGGIIYIRGNSSCTIQKNLFYDNPNAYVVLWEDSDSPTWILNNTIYGGRQGLILWGISTTAYGNIVTFCDMGVSAVAGANTAYNDIWGNGADWSFGSAGPLDISVNPEFVDSTLGNFYLKESSLLIDAGNPNSEYNDPDGTINDIGAVSFDQRTPIALNLHLDNYEVTNILEHYPTFHWRFYDPAGTQTAFEIEVGSDRDWTIAENWASGEITSPDTFILYNGAPLDNGSVSYYRVRVNNGSEWGIWNESVFRINSIPSSPILLSPIDQTVVSMFGVRLSIENSIDSEGDELTYDFEIYSDAGMSSLVDGILGLAEYNGVTVTGKIAGLEADTEYWWRSRAFDGYEYSPWSEINSFITRQPIVINVPSPQPTIQAGLNIAEERDTVMVAAGTYAGNGNRDLNYNGTNITLISESGPEQTIIDCGGSESEPHVGIIFENGEESTSVVDGFTISNANAPMLWNNAAVVCLSSPTIKNCNISDNIGDGILCSYGGAPAIFDCIISNNSGAGIRSGWSGLIMKNCLVTGNGEDGFNINYGAIDVSNCTFAYNSGVGIMLYGDPPKINARADDSAIIYNNIIAFNDGGGVKQWFYFSPALQLKCNDAYGNKIEDWSVYGYNVDDEFGNISQDPLFCDPLSGDFSIADISPCAPDNNECAQLLGAKDIGCTMTDIEIIDDTDRKPEKFFLHQNYPNPFNPSTIIEFGLPARTLVEITIYNMRGQKIRTLINEEQSAGQHAINWDGKDSQNNEVASGIYFYKIKTENFETSRKMMLLR